MLLGTQCLAALTTEACIVYCAMFACSFADSNCIIACHSRCPKGMPHAGDAACTTQKHRPYTVLTLCCDCLACKATHQTPSAIFIAFIGVAISKHKREDGLQEVHALTSLLPHAPSPHVVWVQIPKHVCRAEPDSGTSIGIGISIVVATPASNACFGTTRSNKVDCRPHCPADTINA
jgi:hypothetical protein